MSKDISWLVEMIKLEVDTAIHSEESILLMANEIIDSLRRFAKSPDLVTMDECLVLQHYGFLKRDNAPDFTLNKN